MWKLLLIGLSLVVICAFAQEEKETDVEEFVEDFNSTSRNPKIFPFFAVVSFPNSKCTDSVLGSGLCYSSAQCTRNGGTPSATTCAQKYGVCCIFAVTCSGSPPTATVTKNSTQLSGTYAAGTQPCQINIPRQPGVCQVRVDFTMFEVGTALNTGGGDCIDDTVIFKAANFPDGLTLCGIATGQHLYLHYGQLDTVSIRTALSLASSSYKFDLTMIKCDSTEKAPDGCTQYFTAPIGEVRSFNFPVQQLNSEMYSICVKSMIGDSVTWSPCLGMNNTFFISGMSGMDGGDPPPLTGTACTGDYVYIPPESKICGGGFITPITTSASPSLIYVNFDGQEGPPPYVGPIDPMTGCPPGWTCADPPGGMCADTPPGSCIPPPFYFDLLENNNKGFCLRYSVGA